MIDLRKLIQTEPTPIDFCLPALVAGTVGSIIAPGGSGKSFVALQIASQVAGGADLLGIGEVKTGKAVYLPVEDPTAVIEHRLNALFERQNPNQREALFENLLIEPLEKYMPNILDPKWKEAIERLAAGKRLLILDTLALFHTADENNNGEMKKVVATLVQIGAVTGCTILFVHHTAKGSDTKSATASRGAGVLKDNIRWQSYITGITEETAKKHSIKENDQQYFSEFGISKVNFGTSGEPIILKKSFPQNKKIDAIVFERWNDEEVKEDLVLGKESKTKKRKPTVIDEEDDVVIESPKEWKSGLEKLLEI